MRQLTFFLMTPMIFILFFTFAFLQLGGYVQSERILPFDHMIIQFIQGWEQPWLTNVMLTFTTIGDAWTVVLFSVVMTLALYRYRQTPQLILFVTTMIGNALLNALLKHSYVRERPLIHRLTEIGGFSFPSGHTMMALSFYFLIAYLLWQYLHTIKSGIFLFTFALFMTSAIAISRIYLGVHYPSDIIGGLFASGALLLATTTVYRLYQKHIEKQFEHSQL